MKKYTIEEVEKQLGVRPYLIRYWESNFSGINPVKSEENESLYSEGDVELLRKIKRWLIDEDLSLEEARQKLEEDAEEEMVISETEIPLFAEPEIAEEQIEPEAEEEKREERLSELRAVYEELGEIIEMMKRLL